MTQRLTLIEDDVINRYRDGETVRLIAEHHSTTIRTVFNILKRNGVARRRRTGGKRVPFSKADMERLAELRRSGLSKEELQDEMRCGLERLNRALVELGLADRMRRRDTRERIYTNHGYAYVLIGADDPLAVMRGANKYVLEHRVVMARHLGRPLAAHETVHHINGIRDDNRIENLQLRQGAHGKGAHFVCCDCGSRNVRSAHI